MAGHYFRAQGGREIRQNIIGLFWPIKQIWVNLNFSKLNDIDFEKYLHEFAQNSFLFFYIIFIFFKYFKYVNTKIVNSEFGEGQIHQISANFNKIRRIC
jgi:hypothetical protein